MTWSSLLKKPSAMVPFLMSLAAAALMVGYLAVNGMPTGPQPPHDEGAAARTFQLLLAFQVPVALVFMARWVPREPQKGIVVLLLQVLAALAALAPVVILER